MVNNYTVQTVPAKLPSIVVYLAEELKEDLRKLADVENRTMSNLAATLLQEAVEKAKREGKI